MSNRTLVLMIAFRETGKVTCIPIRNFWSIGLRFCPIQHNTFCYFPSNPLCNPIGNKQFKISALMSAQAITNMQFLRALIYFCRDFSLGFYFLRISSKQKIRNSLEKILGFFSRLIGNRFRHISIVTNVSEELSTESRNIPTVLQWPRTCCDLLSVSIIN